MKVSKQAFIAIMVIALILIIVLSYLAVLQKVPLIFVVGGYGLLYLLIKFLKKSN